MKVINSKNVKVDTDSKHSVKSDIRVKKNRDKLIIKTLLLFTIVNSIMISLVVASIWNKIISWF